MEAPLYQRYSKVFKIASVSLHAFSAAQFCFGCYYDWFHVNIPAEVSPIFSAFGYKLKFLTYWDALLQAAYFSLCVVNDVIELIWKTDQSKSHLKKAKDFIYASFAFPIAMFVGTTFWGLMAVDRELVLPARLDPYFPAWINHIMHTNIVICQLLETVTSDRQYPSFKTGIPSLFVFQSAYISWMYVVHGQSGLWVYPIFDVLSTPLRILFLGGCFVTGLLFYLAGYRINSLLWDGKRLEGKKVD